MKILKIVFISIIALVIVLSIGAVIFIKTFDVNRFKPQIISQADKILNRRLDFQKAKLGISLRQGISLKINNLTISDDPAFGKDNFLLVKEVSLGVDLLKLIFQAKINISDIVIDSPRVVIIRNKDGSINAQSIAQTSQIENKESMPVKPSAALAMPALLISSLEVKNGRVTYIDNLFEPPVHLEVSDLSISLTKFSLSESFPFLIEANILSSQNNIKIAGKAQIDLKRNEASISELKATSDLSKLLMEKFPTAFPMLKGVILPVSLKGAVDITVQKITAGLKGLSPFKVDASLTNGQIQLKELVVPVKDIVMSAKITDKDITISNVSASIGRGTIKGQAFIGDYLAKQSYTVDGAADNLDLQELLPQDKMPVKTEGIAAAKLRIKGEGFSLEAVKTSLSGTIAISIEKAKLKDINVLHMVLDKITIIPGLSNMIVGNLPDKFQGKLDQKDTQLKDIKLPVRIENGRFIIDDATLEADEFIFNGKGYAGFDAMYSLEGSFLIPPEFSLAMVNSVAQLQYLLNSDKQIYIPLKISGNAATMQFTVDAGYIAKKMLIEQGTQQLFKVIEKALGAKTGSQSAEEASSDSGRQGSGKINVKDILQGIFK